MHRAARMCVADRDRTQNLYRIRTLYCSCHRRRVQQIGKHDLAAHPCKLLALSFIAYHGSDRMARSAKRCRAHTPYFARCSEYHEHVRLLVGLDGVIVGRLSVPGAQGRIGMRRYGGLFGGAATKRPGARCRLITTSSKLTKNPSQCSLADLREDLP